MNVTYLIIKDNNSQGGLLHLETYAHNQYSEKEACRMRENVIYTSGRGLISRIYK